MSDTYPDKLTVITPEGSQILRDMARSDVEARVVEWNDLVLIRHAGQAISANWSKSAIDAKASAMAQWRGGAAACCGPKTGRGPIPTTALVHEAGPSTSAPTPRSPTHGTSGHCHLPPL